MAVKKPKRDNVAYLERIVSLPATEIQFALKQIGHMRSCPICDNSKWILESVSGKATPLRFEGFAGDYTVAFQLTCEPCGHLRFIDAQTVYAHIMNAQVAVQ